jgi:hypothetical protein
MDVIFSEAGYARGFGSDRWRYVAGLSDDERQAVINKTAIVVVDRPFLDRFGDWYVVYCYRGYWGHRLPSKDERQLSEQVRK